METNKEIMKKCDEIVDCLDGFSYGGINKVLEIIVITHMKLCKEKGIKFINIDQGGDTNE